MCTAAIPGSSMSSWDLNRDVTRTLYQNNTFKCVPLSGIGNYETDKDLSSHATEV